MGEVFLGKTPVPKMKNGRNPIPLKITRGVLGLLGGGLWGRSPVPKQKMAGAPFTQKKGRRKRKKGEGIRKNTGVVENPNTRVR